MTVRREATAAALLLSLGLLIPGPAWSQAAPAPPPEQIHAFPAIDCGLVTNYSGHVIGGGCLQEAKNILYDQDFGFQRRDGRSKWNVTALSTPTAIRRLYSFDATDGTEYAVAVSSDKLWEAGTDASFAVITGMTGLSASANTDCVQGLGKFWCVNQTNGLVWWNGTSTAAVSAGPKGALIDMFRHRLIIGNVDGAQSRIYLSGHLDGEDWTTGAQSTSPVIQPVGGINDGAKITCLMGTYNDAYIIGKRSSLWALYGFDNNDFALREISRQVGCIDDTSVQEMDGSLYWVSTRGVEKMTGTRIDWTVSDPILDGLEEIVASAGNTRKAIDTTQEHFEEGNVNAAGTGAPMSTTILPNSVVSSTWGLTTGGLDDASWDMADVDTTSYVTGYLDNFDSNTYQNVTAGSNLSGDLTWNVYRGTMSLADNEVHPSTGSSSMFTSVTSATGTWSVVFKATGSAYGNNIYLYVSFDSTTGNGYHGTVSGFGTGSTNVHLEYCVAWSCPQIASQNSTENIYDGSTHTFRVTRATNGFMTATLDGIVSTVTTHTQFTSGTAVGIFTSINAGDSIKLDSFRFPDFYQNQISRSYDTGFSTPTWGQYSVSATSYTTSSATYQSQSSSDTVTWSAWTAPTSDALNNVTVDRYLRHRITIAAPETVDVATITSVSLDAATTGQFISQCRNSGSSITKWGLISCNLSDFHGSWTIDVATGTTCHSVAVDTAPWTTQTNNTLISVATGPYVAYRLEPSFSTFYSTANLAVQDCTINWVEGAVRPEVASAVYDHKYHLFYTTTTSGSPANTTAYVLDRQGRWSYWNNTPARSAVFFDGKLLTGDGAANGRVYQLYTGTDDDGSAFETRVRFPDWDLGNWRARKTFGPLYLELEPEPDPADDIDIVVTGYVDKLTSVSLGEINLGEDTGIIAARVPWPLDNQAVGRYIGIELTETGKRPWKYYRGAMRYRQLREE